MPDKFTVNMDTEKARAQNSVFRLHEYPVAVSAVRDTSGGLGRTAERLL